MGVVVKHRNETYQKETIQCDHQQCRLGVRAQPAKFQVVLPCNDVQILQPRHRRAAMLRTGPLETALHSIRDLFCAVFVVLLCRYLGYIVLSLGHKSKLQRPAVSCNSEQTCAVQSLAGDGYRSFNIATPLNKISSPWGRWEERQG